MNLTQKQIVEFIKSDCLPIELHWDLADDYFFKQIFKFQEDMLKII